MVRGIRRGRGICGTGQLPGRRQPRKAMGADRERMAAGVMAGPWDDDFPAPEPPEDYWANERAAAAERVRSNQRGHDDCFTATRAEANTVTCRDCKAPAGEDCVDRAFDPPRVLAR